MMPPRADPQATFAEYAAAYVEYLRVFRELEETHDQMVQPQKRESVRECLEATLGRALEMKRWLVYLNGGLEAVSLEDALLDLGLTPDALAVPVPRYYATPTRRRSRRATAPSAERSPTRKPGSFESRTKGNLRATRAATPPRRAAATPRKHPGPLVPRTPARRDRRRAPPGGSNLGSSLLDADPSKKERSYLKKMHPLSHLEPIADIDEAMMIIQRNERGRQARAKAEEIRAMRRRQAAEDRARGAGNEPKRRKTKRSRRWCSGTSPGARRAGRGTRSSSSWG